MSDAFYQVVRFAGRHVFWASSSPVVSHADRTRRAGAFVLASNHTSPYDVPLLMRHTARNLDFVSIVEVFRKPLVGRFYGAMNAFPLDRSRPDGPTVRVILDRLARGRAVAMFPEGGIRRDEDSIVRGGQMRPGIGRLAMLANVPILPAVVIGSGRYSRFTSWLPIRRTRYGVIYGEPLIARPDLPKTEAAEDLEVRLRKAFVALHQELTAALAYKP
jgi:1-acyl-sn-glycerol-3-phosphate acyltransferase